MKRYMNVILRRLGFYIVALFTAITLNFFILKAMPGDPATIMFGGLQGRVPLEVLESLKKEYGYDKGLWEQYTTYIGMLMKGDLGTSVINYPEPVKTSLFYAMRWTLYLVGAALFIAFTTGVTMGMTAAWRRGSFFDVFFTPFNVILSSFNPAVVSLLLLFFFCIHSEIFPLGRAYNLDLQPGFTWPFIKDVIYHSFLPILSIVIVTVGGWHLAMRNNMINLLNEDYVTMAKAKGLKSSRVMLRYAARNAILPVTTQLAMCMGFVFGGAIFTEVVFNYPGLGKFTLTAINSRDYAFIQGQLLFITVIVLFANLMTDVVNVILDPRLRRAAVK